MMNGEEIHGELSSADAHLGVAVGLTSAGSVTARVVAADEVVAVTDILIATVAGGVTIVKFIDGSNVITVFKGTLAAGSVFTHQFATPVLGLRGKAITVVAPVGQIDVTIQGAITH